MLNINGNAPEVPRVPTVSIQEQTKVKQPENQAIAVDNSTHKVPY